MNKRDQYKRILNRFASLVLVLAMTGLFAWVWYSYYDNEKVLGETFWRRGNYVVIALYAAILCLFYNVFGTLKIGRMRLFEAALTQVLALLATNVVTYLQLCLIGRWKFLSFVTPILWLTVMDLVVSLVWVFLAKMVQLRLYPPRKLLVVYGQYSPDNLIRKMATRADKYDISETISIERDIEEIYEKISHYHNVILADIPDEIRNKLVKYCFAHDVRCYTVPKISDVLIKSSHLVHEFDTTLLLFRNSGLNVEERFLKRCLDVVAALICMVIFSPFMLIISIAIKCYDGGPVLFTQDRLTEGGKVFKLYKFRSMRVEQGEGDYCLTRKEDDRVTPIGKVIRNIHFDELPQLINILKGDMSIVGPRPECPALAEKYGKIIPEFDYRLKVKAGLTGYAQVYGKYNTTPYDKLKLDLTYIRHYSIWLDLKLILLTVKILFHKENAEGVESWKTNAATKENLEKLAEK